MKKLGVRIKELSLKSEISCKKCKIEILNNLKIKLSDNPNNVIRPLKF